MLSNPLFYLISLYRDLQNLKKAVQFVLKTNRAWGILTEVETMYNADMAVSTAKYPITVISIHNVIIAFNTYVQQAILQMNVKLT